jgi:chromate transporter
VTAPAASPGSALEVLGAALKLGLTSFGGPVAHIGYFRTEYVERRRWLPEATFTDLVALTQALPGPASSELGIAIGILRAGLRGGLAAWCGFTLPSAVAMVVFALGLERIDTGLEPWIHGLKLVAVAVVAMAVVSMARNLRFGALELAIAGTAALLSLLIPTALTQVAIIAAGAVVGRIVLRSATGLPSSDHVLQPPIGRRTAVAAAVLFGGCLVGLPLAAAATGNHAIGLLDTFDRAGSLVFGGGHVVLPLLEREVVPNGWIGTDQFLAGYGAAQAVPGPLFSFAAFLGARMTPDPNGVVGAVICLVAIFLPGFLLVVAVLPSWTAIRMRSGAQSALRGVSAAVVGILTAALYDPVGRSAIVRPLDGLIAATALIGLAARVPQWLVVVATVVAAVVLAGTA